MSFEEPQARSERMRALAKRPRHSGVYPWADAYRAYVEGWDTGEGAHVWPTLDAVADRFGIKRQRVRFVSMRDGWVATRDSFKARLEQRVELLKIRALARARVDVDTASLAIASTGMDLVKDRMAEVTVDRDDQRVARQAYEELKREGADPETLEATGYNPWATSAIDARELQSLASALGGFQQVAHRAVGAPDGRVELTGQGGGPIELRADLRHELQIDDVDRVTALLEMAQRVRVGELPPGTDDGILEAELVE